MTNASEWLATTPEEAIEPDLPIIDPHHHLWDRPTTSYVLGDIVADAAGHNVRQTVFIECSWAYREDGSEAMKVIGETDYCEGVAQESAGQDGPDICAAIIGSADLTLGDAVAPVLEAHRAASPGRFRGIRHRAAWDASDDVMGPRAKPPSDLLMQPAFREGFAHLAANEMTFEAWLFHPQIPQLEDLAKAFPETTMIVNHLAGPLGIGPYRLDEVFEGWKAGITALAGYPNLVIKVGGIQMPLNGFGWHERERAPTSDELLEENRRWYMHAIEAFGPERCMFESNFPVDRASCSYTVVWNQFKKLSADFSDGERAAMLHDTAARVYRLERK
ncbi:MAG: amidohydrolase family protein [Dehalococcoidia bacterium]|nr:amidohydrolase family protein [Dehalococcoidia bacterium]